MGDVLQGSALEIAVAQTVAARHSGETVQESIPLHLTKDPNLPDVGLVPAAVLTTQRRTGVTKMPSQRHEVSLKAR